ncbi:tetratricopeptide repeat protein [Ascidiimonas sp. W6]|uniref:tetratricopeptide repeat protein n=1 Tax=Ascidiimonas meishanensis TaxID=3128903 RepID=UPI0030EEC36F
MTKQIICFLFFGLVMILGYAQNPLQKGFSYLENGNYAKAEVFFKGILKTDPENKTALLCYGRAVGLNGKPEDAITIFTQLLDRYPDDFEIQLNYAESLLWGEQYDLAEKYYIDLVALQPNSFPALLGYANTLSNLKKYESALLLVNKALAVIPGNKNALLSKKYIRLGYANQFSSNQQYDRALDILSENLIDFPKDKETLLNIANIYLITKNIEKANSTYKALAINQTDSIIALNGMALAAHINNEDKKALDIAKKALVLSKKMKEGTLLEQTQNRYAQALIWNRNYSNAEDYIEVLAKKYKNENWLLSLKATLDLYRSNFKKSIEYYQAMLVNDSTSFDANLGVANAYKARDNTKAAYRAASQTLKIYPNQKDAVNFLEKIDLSLTPLLDQKVAYTFDNGNNTAISTNTNVQYPLSYRLTLTANFDYRNTQNSITDNEASAYSLNTGLAWKLLPGFVMNMKGGLLKATSFSGDYTAFIGETFVNLKLLKLQDIEIGYKREVQNFNADLLNRSIISNNYYINHNLSSNFNLGWFTQYFFTSQNDSNERNLFFTSLYYTILRSPVLKTGFNYQYIAFKNQVPEIYFSPERFNAVEIFADFLKTEDATLSKEWFYQLSAATGFQFIEDQKKQSTYRLTGIVGYKFSDRLLTSIYGKHSNIASATAAGFTFTEIGLQLKLLLNKKPMFARD